MIDFFTFSLHEFLTTLRVLFVIGLFLFLAFVLFATWFYTSRAVSYARFRLNVMGEVQFEFKDYISFIRLCFDIAYNHTSSTFKYNDGSYWRDYQDWRYYDRKNHLWVLGKKAKEPVYNDDED